MIAWLEAAEVKAFSRLITRDIGAQARANKVVKNGKCMLDYCCCYQCCVWKQELLFVKDVEFKSNSRMVWLHV